MELLGTYVGQLREGIQTLIQGPPVYRLASSMNNLSLGVRRTEFGTAARLVVAALDAGPHLTCKFSTLFGNGRPPGAPSPWPALRPLLVGSLHKTLVEATRGMFTAYWEGVEDNPHRKFNDRKSMRFQHQRL